MLKRLFTAKSAERSHHRRRGRHATVPEANRPAFCHGTAEELGHLSLPYREDERPIQIEIRTLSGADRCEKRSQYLITDRDASRTLRSLLFFESARPVDPIIAITGGHIGSSRVGLTAEPASILRTASIDQGGKGAHFRPGNGPVTVPQSDCARWCSSFDRVA